MLMGGMHAKDLATGEGEGVNVKSVYLMGWTQVGIRVMIAEADGGLSSRSWETFVYFGSR